jgi:hypothetical protein
VLTKGNNNKKRFENKNLNRRKMIEVKKKYQKSSSMVGRKVGNELILVPISQNIASMEYIYTLNEVAGRIWELLDDSITIAEIVSNLTKEYAVEVKQAEADVVEFISNMKEIQAVDEI